MEKSSRKEKVIIQVFNQAEEVEHFHQDIELLYVLEGTLDVKIGDEVTNMQPEDVLVINANKGHRLKSTDKSLVMKVSIQYQMVSEVLHSMDIIFWCNSTKDESERYQKLRELLKVLLKHDLEAGRDTANFGHIALCYRVVDVLSMYFLVQTADREGDEEGTRYDSRIQLINNYIRANYNQPISMKQLADELYLSNGYLSRFFKKNYGMNFVEYLTNIRLYHAVDDLLYTKTPITRIAFENGFASMAVFNKVFKKAYGETPTEFRKKACEKNPQAAPKDTQVEERLEKYILEQGQTEEKFDSEKVETAQFSVSNTVKMNNYWGNMINVGSASDLLKSDLCEHLILLKEAFGFEYVRFWNIFSKDMLIDLEEEDNYNFSKLDVILDFLVAHGLKPHIEMAAKPTWIMYNVGKAYREKAISLFEISPGKWEKVIEAMMHHLVFRYGREEVNQWRMELWFDEGEWDKADSYGSYFQMFDILCKVVKGYCENLEIGGCGIRMDFNEESRKLFIREWMKQEYKPEYISVGQFAYDRGEEKQDRYSKRSTDNECVKHRILHERALIDQAAGTHMKLYVSEWNLTASSRNYMNDTCFKGAYIIKNILDLYGLADDVGYFIGSDRINEYYDTNQLLYGGTGLISRDGILKPAGFAYEFLKRLYPYFVGKSENYLITTDQHGNYGIVCHNQKTLGYNYFYTLEDEVAKERMWRYFENRDHLDAEIELKGVTDGLYQVKYYCINEKCGSVLNIWEDMGFEKELSRNDIKYFRRVCEPKLTIQKCRAENEMLRLHLNLMENEIGFMKVRLITN